MRQKTKINALIVAVLVLLALQLYQWRGTQNMGRGLLYVIRQQQAEIEALQPEDEACFGRSCNMGEGFDQGMILEN